ncbi:MAG: cytochrome c oxidase subunit 3 [Flavobacteriales bacterium]|nr:cytochrome c oxidase subunit 3 [Flavobacteriales bacterium]MCW8912467.1 cytochrome c oxidase subunit 3 [Flavobacteriales bacterium]MCW8936551.1 cytochrome c oxidase subunit 3 [Flavobacteriales bacterium]MCW8940960.1 cytochrome c oxidase subunit 3 [Flavobacteriales bacterium]MCW8968014.1 cytochrome c oxidase subunit 3 [Flavobacteriales bacterium]
MTTIVLENNDYKKEIKQKTAKPLLWIGLVSIVMFFAGLTSAVIVSKGTAVWESIQIPSAFAISTVFILLSSLTFYLGENSLKNNNIARAKIFILATLILGLLFSITQYLAWTELYKNGVVWAGSESSAAGSYFYALTALHLLHLLGGLISLLVVSFKSMKERYNEENLLGVQLSSTYWHFLTALWVYLYLFLIFIA